MHYEEIFKALNRKKVRYLVTGGVAVNLYGLARMTLDLDLLIALDQKNKTLFYDLMQELKFKVKNPDLARQLMLEDNPPKDIKVITFYRKEFELIDVFIQNPIDFDKAFKKRKIFKSGKTAIPTIPYDLLLRMKQESGRERDLIDVGYLKKLKGIKK
jgi:hypothetical protein